MNPAAATTDPDSKRQKASVAGHGFPAGYFFITAACMSWAVSASLGRAAFTGHLFPGSGIARVSPLILSQARTTFSFIAVLIALLAFRGIRRLCLPRPDLRRMFLLGLAGVAPSNYFYYLAIQRTNVATAIILQYTAPVWVLVYVLARGREKPTPGKLIAVLLAITGVAMVIGVFGRGRLHPDPLGVAAALIAALSFSYYNIYGHSILLRFDRWTVLLYTTLAASLFWLLINPPSAILAEGYSLVTCLFLFAFSVVSVLVPFALYFAGLERLDPTKAVVTGCLEPVFTIMIAAITLGEEITPLQGLGMAMVLTAIVVVQQPASTSGAFIEPID